MGIPVRTALRVLAMLAVGLGGLLPPIALGAQESKPSKLKEAVDGYNREVEKLNQMTADVQVSLTFPVGKSPKVFTRGWVFGARCLVNPGTKEQLDISDEVHWKGTGTFVPDRGPKSRPVFNAPGTNRITLYFEEEGKVVFEKSFTVEAVDPAGYARMSDRASCPADYHGCPACPHSNVIGPITSGSQTVFIDGISAARVGDVGIHAACCGKNEFVIKKGDVTVLIDGKPAARRGDPTQHCGGMGRIVEASGKR